MPAKPLNDAQIGGLFLFNSDMTVPYSKPALSFLAQVKLLKSRGVLIDDEQFAEKFLSHVNYYRLSAYMYPFLKDKSQHIFKPKTTFNNIVDLYEFDSQLRSLIFKAISKIEISIRTNILYQLAHLHGQFWISDNTLFKDQSKHSNLINKIQQELKRSDEEFLSHFKNTYSDPIPPVWMTLELSSFGTLSILYANFKSAQEKKQIAHIYALPIDIFESWIHSLCYIRNICAHHARLWNRAIQIRPLKPKKPIINWKNDSTLNNQKLFYSIAVISFFLQKIDSDDKFAFNLTRLLEKYQHIDISAMGFPSTWKTYIHLSFPKRARTLLSRLSLCMKRFIQ